MSFLSYYISIGKRVFDWRPVSLTMFCLMVVFSGKAQSDTVLISRLLKDGSYYLLKSGSEKKDLDSASYFFDKALSLSLSVGSDRWINASLEWKGDYYLKRDILDSGKSCFQKVINYYHQKGQLAEEAKTWRRLGDGINNGIRSFAPAKAASFEYAYQLYRKMGDSLKALESLKDAADAHMYEPNLDLAEKELLSVAESYKAMHFRNIHFTYDLLSAVAGLKGDLAKEVFYTMEMVRVS